MRIGDRVRVTVVSVSGGQVRLAVDAPESISIHREEVFERIVAANREAAEAACDSLEVLEEAATERPGKPGEGLGWRNE